MLYYNIIIAIDFDKSSYFGVKYDRIKIWNCNERLVIG